MSKPTRMSGKVVISARGLLQKAAPFSTFVQSRTHILTQLSNVGTYGQSGLWQGKVQ